MTDSATLTNKPAPPAPPPTSDDRVAKALRIVTDEAAVATIMAIRSHRASPALNEEVWRMSAERLLLAADLLASVINDSSIPASESQDDKRQAQTPFPVFVLAAPPAVKCPCDYASCSSTVITSRPPEPWEDVPGAPGWQRQRAFEYGPPPHMPCWSGYSYRKLTTGELA